MEEDENSSEVEVLIKKQQWRNELKEGDEVEILRKIVQDRCKFWDFEPAVVRAVAENDRIQLTLMPSKLEIEVGRYSHSLHLPKRAKAKQQFRETLKPGDQVICYCE